MQDVLRCTYVSFFPSDSPSGKVISVDIIPCSTDPCQLHKGQSYTVNVTFTSGELARLLILVF